MKSASRPVGFLARLVQGSGRGELVGSVAGASAGITYGGSLKGEPVLLGPDDNFELLINTIGLLPAYPRRRVTLRRIIWCGLRWAGLRGGAG